MSAANGKFGQRIGQIGLSHEGLGKSTQAGAILAIQARSDLLFCTYFSMYGLT